MARALAIVRSSIDSKNKLQEFVQANGATTPPKYETEQIEGIINSKPTFLNQPSRFVPIGSCYFSHALVLDYSHVMENICLAFLELPFASVPQIAGVYHLLFRSLRLQLCSSPNFNPISPPLSKISEP